jgi:protease-4
VAHELTITGSIGVILSTWNYRGLMNKVGIRPMVYKSGKFKDMLSGSRDPDTITEEERQMVQTLIDEVYAKFKSVVANGREQANKNSGKQGQTLSLNWEEYADGRVLSGSEAFKLGFVDELGDFEEAVKRAKKIAGVREANLVEYRPRYDLADLLGFLGRTDSQVIKVDVGLEVPKLQAGQLYFLSPTVVN